MCFGSKPKYEPMTAYSRPVVDYRSKEYKQMQKAAQKRYNRHTKARRHRHYGGHNYVDTGGSSWSWFGGGGDGGGGGGGGGDGGGGGGGGC